MSYRKQPEPSPTITSFCAQFELSKPLLCDIMRRLKTGIEQGLSKETHENAIVKCFATYIQNLPTGKETGRYLSIYLGGVSFKILLITLGQEKNECKVDSRVYAFPEETMRGTADEFFNYLAECTEAFKTALKLPDENYPLAFCFSFPYKLTGINSGHLIQWTKRFNVSGVVGKDVVALLQQALDKRKLKIKVVALVNDTVSCLMSAAWKDRYCRMGVIVGTGTNACYLEKIGNVGFFDDKSKPFMVINTEWGNFGSDGALNDIVTDIDRQLDSVSLRPGSEIFEKMVGSMYVCELVRLCIVKCADMNYLFQGEVSTKLREKGILLPEYIHDIEKDEGEMLKTLGVLENLGIGTATLTDCVNVRHITHSVCSRSANLVSSGIAMLINRMSVTPVTVAIDGNMYKHHPTYKDIVRRMVTCMVNPKIEVNLTTVDDECGKGVALAAANVARLD